VFPNTIEVLGLPGDKKLTTRVILLPMALTNTQWKKFKSLRPSTFYFPHCSYFRELQRYLRPQKEIFDYALKNKAKEAQLHHSIRCLETTWKLLYRGPSMQSMDNIFVNLFIPQPPPLQDQTTPSQI
jgi:hypothetical protein